MNIYEHTFSTPAIALALLTALTRVELTCARM